MISIQHMMDQAYEQASFNRGRGECSTVLEPGQDAGQMKRIAENNGFKVATNGDAFTVIKPKWTPIKYPKVRAV